MSSSPKCKNTDQIVSKLKWGPINLYWGLGSGVYGCNESGTISCVICKGPSNQQLNNIFEKYLMFYNFELEAR